MKLITSSQSQQLAVSNPRVNEVMQVYGDQRQVALMLSPAHYLACPCEFSVALMLVTYGRDTLADILKLHLSKALITLGTDKADPALITTIAESIIDCPENHVRLLTFDNLIRFFPYLTQGLIQLYGVTHHSIMQAFQEYARKAFAHQQELQQVLRRQEKEREQQEHERDAISWEQYAALRGIDPDQNPLDYARFYNKKGD